MVSRRQTLKFVGGTAVGFEAVTGVVGAERGDSGGKSAENRPTTRVYPFGDQPVPVGDAIEHSVGWVENCGTVEERLARMDEFLDKIELDVHIEGVDVGDTAQYWGDPVVDGDQVFVWWRLVTEPRPRGVYDFDMTMRFTEPYTSQYAAEGEGCKENERDGVIFEGDTVYEVTPDARTTGDDERNQNAKTP